MPTRFSTFKTILATLAVATLAACATTRPPPWEQQRPRLQQLADWRLNAGLLLRSPERNASLSVDWRQRGEAYRMCLRDILGRGLACVDGDASGAVVRYPRQAPQSLSAEELAAWRPIEGVALPLAELPNWLKGLPAAAPRQGLAWPSRHAAAGWLVRWDARRRHRGPVGDVWLPRRMSIGRESVRLQLRGMRWRLGAEAL